jgi:cell wall-associated NlpC family hydrolase
VVVVTHRKVLPAAHGPTRGIAQGAGIVGFDCSGLTRYAFAHAGIPLPRTAEQQWSAPGLRIATFAALQPGDLVFFATNPASRATIHHVAIALGHDSMIEAPRTRRRRPRHPKHLGQPVLG